MTIPNTCTIIAIVLCEAAVTCPVSYQSRQDDGEIEIALARPDPDTGCRLDTGHKPDSPLRIFSSTIVQRAHVFSLYVGLCDKTLDITLGITRHYNLPSATDFSGCLVTQHITT